MNELTTQNKRGDRNEQKRDDKHLKTEQVPTAQSYEAAGVSTTKRMDRLFRCYRLFTFGYARGHFRSALEITNGVGPEGNSWGNRAFVFN